MRADAQASRRTATCVLAVVAGWLLPACAHDPAPHTRRVDGEPAVERASARVEGERFVLTMDAPRVTPVGEGAGVLLSMTGRGEYHINREYPLRLLVRATPGVDLVRRELDLSDATELAPDGLGFELAYSCREPGEHRIEVDLEFALCTDVTCIPEARSIALDVCSQR